MTQAHILTEQPPSNEITQRRHQKVGPTYRNPSCVATDLRTKPFDYTAIVVQSLKGLIVSGI